MHQLNRVVKLACTPIRWRPHLKNSRSNRGFVTPRFSARPDWRIRTGFRDARPYTEALYLIFFFQNSNLYLWVWPTSYNIIKISYTFTESHLQLQNCTFTFTNQSTEPTCSEPLLVCWPSSMRKSSDVFSCTYTD